MISDGCVYRRCGCVDPATGRQYGRACPQLAAGGRHGSWYVRLELPAGLDGRRRRIRRGGYPSRAAAMAVLARLRAPRPGDTGARMLTVGDWLAHWLVSRTATAPSTVRGYTAHVRLYLTPYLGEILLGERAHRDRQRAEAGACGPGYRPSGFVFTNLNGDPMAPDRLTRTFRQLAAEAGLPPVRLHDLRHGAATLALAAGVDLRVVQDMLGHSSIVLTADTYTSVLPVVAHTAAEKVATLIIQAGRLIPGTRRRRRRQAKRSRRGSVRAGRNLRQPPVVRRSRAHAARQIGHPRPRHRRRA